MPKTNNKCLKKKSEYMADEMFSSEATVEINSEINLLHNLYPFFSFAKSNLKNKRV